MEDLMRFARPTDLAVVTHIAVAHAQFETIHPFPDGNGRVGRALAQSMLRHAGVTTRVTVPVSAGLLADTARYFDALTAYRAGDPAPIIEMFTESIFRALTNARRSGADLDQLRGAWEYRVVARAGSAARRALDLLAAQPVVSAAHVAEQLNVSTVTAGNAIEALVEAGVLEQASTGRRNRHWQATEVLDALDAFGRRARRG